MNIGLVTPISKAWQRMTDVLFKAFDISKWFTLGFAVFLADLMEYPGGIGSYNFDKNDIHLKNIFKFPEIAGNWLHNNPVWFSLIIIGVILIIVIIVLFTWLSSRGQFIFLDNVVGDKSEIVKPWYDYKALANSLFIWRLVFGFILFICFLLIIGFGLFILYDIYYGILSTGIRILFIMSSIFFALIIICLSLYIYLLLNHFVLPIMYKFNVKINNAWIRFLKIFKSHVGHFILYGLFVLALEIVIFSAVVLVGLFTCCCGFLILMIPYISSVVLLPVSFLIRSFSLYYLEQFGEEYTFFKEIESQNPNY